RRGSCRRGVRRSHGLDLVPAHDYDGAVGVSNRSVDVVVVTYQSADEVERCLSAVRAAATVASVTVVDNGSTDGSADVAGRLADIVHVLPDNPGFGAAQNHGARQGSAPYLLVLNPDAVIDADAIAHGIAFLESHASVAAVQGE